jgi:hypothetical protein
MNYCRGTFIAGSFNAKNNHSSFLASEANAAAALSFAPA